MIKTDTVLTIELVQEKQFSPAELQALILAHLDAELNLTHNAGQDNILRTTPKFAIGDFVKGPSKYFRGGDVYGIVDGVKVVYNEYQYSVVYISATHDLNRQEFTEKHLELI